jgi:hypothetical protein
MLNRFVLGVLAAVLAVGAFLFWGGGFSGLLESLNDLFVINP